MSSIVLELQRDAMDRHTDVGDLLRKAMVIARKLQLREMAEWCGAELNGYTDQTKLPEYRIVAGEIKVFNPYNGVWMEMSNGGRVRTGCQQPVAELQELTAREGMIGMTASPEIAKMVSPTPTPPRIILQQTSLIGILDAVRNSILDWTLKLEEDGILGAGMTFSAKEKQSAMNNGPTYNIGNFNGVLGNVTSQNAQIGYFQQIESQLKEAQISAAERKELGNLMEALPEAAPAEKKNIVAKGLNWVTRNAVALGTLSGAIKTWFEIHQNS